MSTHHFTSSEYGILTMATGSDAVIRACTLARSARVHAPNRNVALITLEDQIVAPGYFDQVIRIALPEPFTGQLQYLNKLIHPFKLTPFERTLFLDDDILLIRPIDGFVEQYFEGCAIALNTQLQDSTDSCPGANHLIPAEVAKLTGRKKIYNVYGGGHYYFERGQKMQQVIDAALNFATSDESTYWTVAGPSQKKVSDELALLFAMNSLGVKLPTAPDFVDALNLSLADQIHLSSSRSKYIWTQRQWGAQIDDVLMLHFCTTGKRSLPYSREVFRLTGMRQSFDRGPRGRLRRVRHAARPVLRRTRAT